MDSSDLTISSSSKLMTAALAACTTTFVCFAAFAQSGATMIAIDKMTIGEPPTDFDSWRTGQGGPARWMVVADATASGGRAIEQVSTDKTDHRFPLAIYKPVSARNVDVVLRFKPVAGTVDQAGGIAVRLSTPDDYYVVRANALEDNVRFYRVVKGKREQLGGTNTKVARNEWHTLGLRAEGDRFTIKYDDKTLYSVTDKTFAGAGRVALWTKADSVTRFDQINITTLP
jgi:hypothetical protein